MLDEEELEKKKQARNKKEYQKSKSAPLKDIPKDCDSEDGDDMDLPLRRTDIEFEENDGTNLYQSSD